ncbi:Hypothetical predicted protein [Olea europaea subsp. europaea]|uniref:Uncharacterized protein n=1 Tax=Olea europaea subsp. europaea TaxID=158383 RepID=A0A8S0VKL1_OLEEU|nr:Hypothetical predicted protein [Olea europaea subsp. europaea]
MAERAMINEGGNVNFPLLAYACTNDVFRFGFTSEDLRDKANGGKGEDPSTSHMENMFMNLSPFKPAGTTSTAKPHLQTVEVETCKVEVSNVTPPFAERSMLRAGLIDSAEAQDNPILKCHAYNETQNSVIIEFQTPNQPKAVLALEGKEFLLEPLYFSLVPASKHPLIPETCKVEVSNITPPFAEDIFIKFIERSMLRAGLIDSAEGPSPIVKCFAYNEGNLCQDETNYSRRNVEEPRKIDSLDEPILNTLPITKFEAMLMIKTYSFRHGLTAVAREGAHGALASFNTSRGIDAGFWPPFVAISVAILRQVALFAQGPVTAGRTWDNPIVVRVDERTRHGFPEPPSVGAPGCDRQLAENMNF